MKMIKKLATLMLVICLAVPCFSMLTYAADGRVMFTDPSAKAGETFEVKGVIERTAGAGFGKVEVTMTYDASLLKFQSGNGVTESQAGKITYSGDATSEVSNRHEFTIQFQALKEGNAKLEIAGATIKSVSGATLNYTKGSSAITIAEGDAPISTPVDVPTGEGATVEVNGESYVISNTLPEKDIPSGYEAATLDYDLETYNVVYNEGTGLYLAYLINEDNIGKFFMYVEEDATFAPFEQISISETVTIALLSDVSEVVLPKEYEETTVVLKDQEFPAWRNSEDPDFCILYAINNKGEKSLYQLDNEEATYQRFTAPEVVEEKIDKSFIGALSDVLENHLDYVILGTGIGFLLFIIIIVILGVKLYNRNAELDEIYDEYGIDPEDDKTEDDVILDLDDDEEDDYPDEEDEGGDEDEETASEAELFVQEGMREVFPEEEIEEASETDEAEDFDDEEDIFANFSMDFIDLDD